MHVLIYPVRIFPFAHHSCALLSCAHLSVPPCQRQVDGTSASAGGNGELIKLFVCKICSELVKFSIGSE